MKTVTGITMKTGLGQNVSGSGTLTENEHYVVSAIARFTGEQNFKPSTRTEGVESRIDMRMDVAVHEYHDKKQGDAVIPYLSMRVLSIKSAKAGLRQFLSGLDNDSNRQYKNLIVSDQIWQAIGQECTRAIEESIKRENTGEQITIVSNIALVKDASAFAEAAGKVALRRAENVKAASFTSIPMNDTETTKALAELAEQN